MWCITVLNVYQGLSVITKIANHAQQDPMRERCLGTGQSLLGVFQKLVSTKAHDHEGFYILNALIESLPPDVISPFLPKVRAPAARRRCMPASSPSITLSNHENAPQNRVKVRVKGLVMDQ